MTDQDVRNFLERMAAEEPVPFLDPESLARRARRRAARTVVVGAVGVAAAVAVLFAGVNAIRTAPVPADDPTPTPLPPPRAGALAYGVDGDIFVADPDGSNAIRIADGAPSTDECAPGEERATYNVFGTAWSPDGRYLAYWDRGCPDPWGTVLISDAQGNVITSFPGQGWTISWSPDSTRVAVLDFWAPDGQDPTIGVYRLDGTRQASLTVPWELRPSGDYSPAGWSRDGSSILFRGAQVPLDGAAPTPFPEEPRDGAYSPDGSRFAYEDRGSLVVEDADEPDAQKVSGAWEEFWSVAWSPNGDLVAFEVDRTQLQVRDVATGTDTALVDVKRPEWLHVLEFSPDGDRILFIRYDPKADQQSLWSIGVDGSDLRRLVDGTSVWADLRP
jgi:Tol biopolymer transport system component